MANSVWQYEQPRCPDGWNESERRFYNRLITVLDDIYAKYGRIDEKMLAKSLVSKVDGAPDAALEKLMGTYESASLDSLYVQELTAQTARIVSLVVEKMVADTISAGKIAADSIEATFASMVSLSAKYANFDFETVKNLTANALVLDKGTADKVFISNLSVAYAQVINATLGSLCLKASDGNYYQLDVGENGVTATMVEVGDDELAAGQTNAGKVILGTDITAENLSTQTLLATQGLVNHIVALQIDVDALTAREAFIEKLTSSELFARLLMANEAFIDRLVTAKIFGDKTLTMIAGEAAVGNSSFRQNEAPTGADLVRIGDTWTAPDTNAVYQAAEIETNLQFSLDADGNMYYSSDAGSLYVEDFDLYASGFAASLLADGTLGDSYVWVRVQDQELLDKIDTNKIHDGEEPPAAPIPTGKIWVDRSSTPSVLRRWLGLNVTPDDPDGWETINDLEEINQISDELAQQQAAMKDNLDNLATAMTIDTEGVHIHKPGYMNQNEMFIDEDSMDAVVGGEVFSSFIPKGAIFGNYMVWQPEAAGGLAFNLIG